MTESTYDTDTVEITPEVIALVNYERKFYATPRKAAEAILDRFRVEPHAREFVTYDDRTRVIRYTPADDGRGGDITEDALVVVMGLPDRPVYPLEFTGNLLAKLTPEEQELVDVWQKADRKWRKAAIAAVEKELGLR